MGFLARKKTFIPTKVKEMMACRPGVNPETQAYEARVRVELEDGQRLDLVMDMKQFKILAVNTFIVAKSLNMEVTNPIADKAATWWGMS